MMKILKMYINLSSQCNQFLIQSRPMWLNLFEPLVLIRYYSFIRFVIIRLITEYFMITIIHFVILSLDNH